MARTETREMVLRMITSIHALVDSAGTLSDEDLDKEVPGYGGRPTRLRNLLYGAANHTREHVNHVNKVLNANGHPAQSEANAILDQAVQALGALAGSTLRFQDEDLGLSHEDQSLRDVLEHVAGTLENFVNYVGEGTKS